jgi:hypothetical protein
MSEREQERTRASETNVADYVADYVALAASAYYRGRC